MCGIAGVVHRERAADEGLIRHMCAQIVHRGPDDEGVYADGACGLGMRRLSIIDLHTGHQPISNEDGTVWVVFNGEIYNYRELRDELESKGHRFRTSSDTEALVHLYEQEGPAGAAKLRGMFAYAIWDAPKKRLVLTRDRFGKKPLYFAETPDGFYFASEIKALRAVEVPAELDNEALRAYLMFGYIPHPRSIYKAIRKVAPGAWLTLDANHRVVQQRYWRVPVPAQRVPAISKEDATAEVRRLFDESVKMRMIADVPLGAFLSGGIDSGSVVASMAMQSGAPVKTYSIGFEEAAYNELPEAELVARQYGTDHHAILVRPDAADLVPRIIRQFDEPFADSSALPTYVVSEFARRDVKVALSGDGGDEFFAGYRSFYEVRRMRLWKAVPPPLRDAIGGMARLMPYKVKGASYLRSIARDHPFERFIDASFTAAQLYEKLVRPAWQMPVEIAHLRRMFDGCLLSDTAGDLAQAIYFEATSKLTEDILVKVDRMSMAASLEVRCPLLDHVLVEFASTLPPKWNMRHGKGKAMLLAAVGSRLPQALLSKPKKGFSVPLADWFRGPLLPMTHDRLSSRRFRDSGIVAPAFVRHLVSEHAAGVRNNQGWLWRLLVLDLWLEANSQVVAAR